MKFVRSAFGFTAAVALGLGSCLDLELANLDGSVAADPNTSIFELLPDASRAAESDGSTDGDDGPDRSNGDDASTGSSEPLPALPSTPDINPAPVMDAGGAVMAPAPVQEPAAEPATGEDYQVCSCTGSTGFIDSVLTPSNWLPADCQLFCRGIDATESRLICFTDNLWSAGTAVPLPRMPVEPVPNPCGW